MWSEEEERKDEAATFLGTTLDYRAKSSQKK